MWCCQAGWILVSVNAHGVIKDPEEHGKIIDWAELYLLDPSN
jgi:hypothetical protein